MRGQTGQQSQNRQPRYREQKKRQRRGQLPFKPFLRKPLWAVFQDDHNFAVGAVPNPANVSTANIVAGKTPDGSSLSVSCSLSNESDRNQKNKGDAHPRSNIGRDSPITQYHDGHNVVQGSNDHSSEDNSEIEMSSMHKNGSDAVKRAYSENEGREEFPFESSDDVEFPQNRDLQQQQLDTSLRRHLTLFDLLSIGVGGTIGSGIFSICGLIANQYAGPATCVSWALAGVAALLSGCCYAELSGRIPTAGSSYAYAYVAMGELPAFVIGAILTLEFLLSGSAVARSWGDKVTEWFRVQLHAPETILRILEPGHQINPPACLVSMATTALVLAGVKESKMVTDFFTWIKVCLVIFMTVGGLLLMDSSNLTPFVPPEFGPSGVLRGSVSSFFGYLGFDAVCCVAGEAIDAEINLPRSIMITLAIVTTLYITAAVALVGMQDYREISPESGFPEGFQANGVGWASQLTAAGEVFTLPVVVLISVVIQPRLQYALAKDGLLPPIFAEIDSTGNPRRGALFAGVGMTLFATFVPFSYLDDFVSAGILIAFTVTNCCLILMRQESPESNPHLLEKLLACFNVFAFVTCLILSHGLHLPIGWISASIFAISSIITAVKISYHCPGSTTFGGKIATNEVFYQKSRRYFSTPFVPFLPCMGMFVNYFLISQLSFMGIIMLVLYMVAAAVIYFVYGARNSVGRINGWGRRNEYIVVEAHDLGGRGLDGSANIETSVFT